MRIFTMSEILSNGKPCIVSVFVVKSYEDGGKDNNNFLSLRGRLMKVFSWDFTDNSPSESHFVANVYFKWDCCTHWQFYGEESTAGKQGNSYYHLCGDGFADFVDELAFVAYVMKKYFISHKDSLENLSRFDLLKIEERYKIEEIEGKAQWFDNIFGYDFKEENL